MSVRTLAPAFWQNKPLQEMNETEWESLCDGCGKCCLQKLENEDTGEVHYTDLACQLFDLEEGGCTDYPNRFKKVNRCIKLTVDLISQFHWLPVTCAYRLLAEGADLPEWHPLVSGEMHSVYDANISIVGKVTSELSVAEELWEERTIRWVD